MKWLLDDKNDLIYMIAIVGDVNIPTPEVFYSDLDADSRNWTDEDLKDFYNSEYVDVFKTISDYITLKHMMKYKELAPDFGYEFTEKQQKIISEGDANNSDSVITSEYYPNIIKLIKKCTRCTMPYTPNFLRNNEFYAEHYMHFAPEDYIAIIQKFRTSNYRNCIHGANPDYYGNLIFQFSRKGEFFDSKGKSLGKHNLWMEISVRQSLDGESVVALVSLNDKENHMDQ